MKITRFKKLITWNVVALAGYLNLVIMVFFIVMLTLSASQLNMRADLNSFFYDNMLRHVIFPYIGFYKTILIGCCLFLIGSVWEKKYYNRHGVYGFRIFENHDRVYSFFFVVGLALNFLPLYLFMMYVLSNIVKII